MKLKKFASMLLACAMIFALAIPSFAATWSDKNAQNVTMKGATTVPKVQVQLPSGTALTNSFLLNPYKIGYSLAIAGTDTTAQAPAASALATTPQVVSPILAITNGTNCKMQVDVTVSTTLGGNLKLMTADYPDATARAADTKNNAFLFVNMVANATAATSATDINTYASSRTGNAAPSIVLKAGDVKNTCHIIQDAASTDSPNYIQIQFGGSMAEGPTTPWTDKDIATVAFAFTFTPNQNAAYPA